MMTSASLRARVGVPRRRASLFLVVAVMTTASILGPAVPPAAAQLEVTLRDIQLPSSYSFVELDGDFLPRTPDGFFGRRDEVLSNSVPLGGDPLPDEGPFEFGTTDTVLRIHGFDSPPETTQTYGASLTDFSWESTSPLRVRVGNRVQRWNVSVTPSELVSQPFGEAAVQPTGLTAGEMDLALRLLAKVVFSRGDQERVLDAGRRNHRRFATFRLRGTNIFYDVDCDDPMAGAAGPLVGDGQPCVGFGPNGFQPIVLDGPGPMTLNFDAATPESPGAPPQVALSANIGSGSHLGSGVVVLEGADIGDNVLIGPNTFVGPRVIIGDNTVIGNSVQLIGGAPERGQGLRIGSGAWIGSGSRIEEGAVIDNGVVTGDGITIGNSFIGENAEIGGDSTIGAGLRIGSNAVLGTNVQIGDSANVGNGIFIAANSVVPMGSSVTNNILTCLMPDGTTTTGTVDQCDGGAVQECTPNLFPDAAPVGQNIAPGQVTGQTRTKLEQDIDASGIAKSNGGAHEYVETTHDCEDFAEEMDTYLTSKGYNVTVTLLWQLNPDWAWYTIFTDKWINGHALNDIHFADGTTIWLEPQFKSTEGALSPANTNLDKDGDGKVELSTSFGSEPTEDGWRIEMYDSVQAAKDAGNVLD